MTTTRKVSVAIYDAHGGPEFRYLAPDGHEAGPTDEGEFRIAYIGRHSSKRYPTWSKVPWGSPLKMEKGELWVRYEGRWQELQRVVSLTRDDVERHHNDLYGMRKIPDTWVFNDFGHITCFLYKDLNRNRRRDPNENIHGEFLHTTPLNEAQTALSKKVILGESHGCIHLKPVDIDEMIRRGYMRKNALVVVHRYVDRKIVVPEAGPATPPYELHFFPALKRLLVLAKAR